MNVMRASAARAMVLATLLALLAGCTTCPDAGPTSLMDELSTVLVDLDFPNCWDVHCAFDSVQEQANSQLPDDRRIAFVVEVPRAETERVTPDYSDLDSLFSGLPSEVTNISVRTNRLSLYQVRLPDAVDYLAGVAGLSYEVRDASREIVIRVKTQDSNQHDTR
ncbi:MAG: hypothetical protein JXB04_04955 [Kiritimatiellae bacterium]|nr:hypothetical protein [Kiritimatiellia bacterium]